MLPLQHSFPPVVNGETRLLVLGSLPGAVSLAERRYYAHPRNHFWTLMSGVIGSELVPLGYEERLAALIEAGVGLWDTVGSGRRKGSLDANIRLHRANDLATLVAKLPELRAVAFNGGKSATIGRRQLGGVSGIELVDLPSSSPAYTLSLDEKRAGWMELRRFV